MTRPHIIRADTIDLQDHIFPSAQDHSRQAQNPASQGIGQTAPHQAAAVRHMQEERHSEEEQLSHAWNPTDGNLHNEPPSDDEHVLFENGVHDQHQVYQRDDSAIQQNGGHSGSHEEEPGDADADDGMDDDMMDKISSSPSIDDEDIDFEFVYALHTFVATVEGQANATKGDTMVLLDDSNSYWWLVRVVKDNSIGYLPAEHIETPTERLARLNKHRNIDLAATMLSDNTEKSKNPLKKAIRRRNAKTVQFSTPQATYFDASDYEYSSSDEEEDDELGELAGAHGIMTKESDELIDEPDRGDVSHIAPLNVKSASKETSTENLQNIDSDNADEERRKDVDSARTSDEIFDRQYSGPGKSRNGTIRNTDSFFKDNTVETKKITLTPNLLRDADRGPAEFRERGTSFDSIEKNLQPDKAKEDKKKKEKKGMLSGLFKRKDKKGKPADSDGSDEKVSYEKSSEEYIRGSARVSEELSPTERGGTVQPADGDRLQRSGSRGKLQKPRPGDLSPFGAQSADRSPEGTSPQPHSPVVSSNGAQQTMRLIEPDTDANRDEKLNLRLRPVDSLENAKAHNVQSSNSSKPIRVKPAQTRMELDDFDSSLDEIEQPTDMHVNSGAPQRQEVLNTGGGEIAERLSESPVQISPVDDHNGDLSQPPALVGDTSSQEENDSLGSSPSMHDISSLDANGAATSQSFPPPPTRPPPTPQAALDLAVSSPFSPSPSMTPTPSAVPGAFPSQATPDYQQKDMHAAQHDSAFQHSSIPSAPPRPVTPPFSAAHLRAFLDDPAPVRDLLLVVHDLNGVVPVGPEHPIMAGLFDQERGDLDKMGKTLDGLLGGWLESRTGKVAGVERKG